MAISGSKLQSFSHKHWIGKTDGGHRHPTEEWFQKYAAELLAMFPSRGTLLDVGCGACQLTTYLAPEFEQVYAVDFSESMLEAARQRVEGCGVTNIKLLYGTAQTFPTAVTRADVILTCAVIQYFSHADFSRHLNECRRILNRDGMICVALVPDAARKKTYYYGYFTRGRFRRLRLLRSWIDLTCRRAKGYLQNDLLWDGIGNWFYQADIEKAAIRAGFHAEFRNSVNSEYRFHALLRPKPMLDVGRRD
jgi:ubiquinone/menaquinone biosynthesis C-methylase UbiE